MNFYPHHIGDYLTATAHLTWLEDCAYRRLLDVYYSRELLLPAEVAQACRLVRAVSKDERKAVETVLTEFFALTGSGWHHSRCEAEIEKAKVASARSKANGMKGGRPAKQKPNPNPKETQQVISGLAAGTQTEPDPKAPITNPITNTNTSEANASGGLPPPDPMDDKDKIFTYGVPMLVNAGSTDKAARSFLAGLAKGHGDSAVVQALRDCIRAKAIDPLTWLAAALPPGGGKKTTGKHTGFDQLDYNEGIAKDGALA